MSKENEVAGQVVIAVRLTANQAKQFEHKLTTFNLTKAKATKKFITAFLEDRLTIKADRTKMIEEL